MDGVGQSLTSLKNVGNYWMMLGDVNDVPRVTPVGEAKKDVAKGRRGKQGVARMRGVKSLCNLNGNY